jgi:hypothetical protein
MNQALYAHMNNKNEKKNTITLKKKINTPVSDDNEQHPAPIGPFVLVPLCSANVCDCTRQF